jgi:hypothetical protein
MMNGDESTTSGVWVIVSVAFVLVLGWSTVVVVDLGA